MIINTDEQIKVVSIGTEERLVANKIDGDTVFKATDLQMGGGAIDLYEGAYTVTPSTYTQTLDINGKTATQDIIIEPIPSNYGLVTWDGAVLTVS